MSSGNPFEKFKKQLGEKRAADQIIDNVRKTAAADFEKEQINEEVLPEENLNKEEVILPDQQFQYVFFPRSDISTLELARILGIVQMVITPDVYEKFPDDLKRHFTTITDLKN